MSEQKGLGSKILGIFVEKEGGAESLPEDPSDAEKSPAEIVAELARKSGAAVPRAEAPVHPEVTPAAAFRPEKILGGSGSAVPSDFNAIFQNAGMDAAELDRVKKAEDLLKSLPDATPQAVKKQIVEASLKAFGYEVEKIVLAAQNQKRALDAYVRVNETATAKGITDAETQIRTLNEKIASLRTEIEKRTGTLGSVSTAAQARKAEIEKVLQFFQTPGTP